MHRHLDKLQKKPGNKKGQEAAPDFLRQALSVSEPEGFWKWPAENRREFLLKKLNRPLRVCGVVKNQGEPGGGPFWVKGPDGSLTLQIVESAQVDLESDEQHEIWFRATHFNPVDLVCSLRDYQGKPFDLRRYVDPGAVFISRKSKEGQALQALELPRPVERGYGRLDHPVRGSPFGDLQPGQDPVGSPTSRTPTRILTKKY